MLPFRGKAQSLSFLKGIGLLVPDHRVISHQELLSWGNPEILRTLQQNIDDESRTLVPLQALAFAATIKIPEIIQLERMKRNWAIRSSANVEDSSLHSFAGVFRTELDIPDDLTPSVRAVWASLYSERALHYCDQVGLSWKDLSMDIILQEMITGEKIGVLFQGPQTLINVGSDLLIMEKDKVVFSYFPEGKSQLNDIEIDKLLGASQKTRQYTQEDLDLEFIFRGSDLYFLQARPLTVRPPIPTRTYNHVGIPCAPGIIEGICAKESSQGKILVSKNSSEALEEVLTGIKGLILEEGALLSHAAILCRELRIPAIMNVPGAMDSLPGSRVRINGDTGRVDLL